MKHVAHYDNHFSGIAAIISTAIRGGVGCSGATTPLMFHGESDVVCVFVACANGTLSFELGARLNGFAA